MDDENYIFWLTSDLHDLLLLLLRNIGQLGLFRLFRERIVDTLGHRMLEGEVGMNRNDGIHLETFNEGDFLRLKALSLIHI